MLSQQHHEQRVGVFIDVQNLYYSAKNLYRLKVNFANILKIAIAGRKLIRAFAYVINADVEGEEHFHQALEKIGFEVRAKDLQVFFGGAKKGDWDVGIAMDVMRMAPKLDTVILVSGDGDFKDLLDYVSSLGCRTEVIAFGKTASSLLKNQADQFIDMDKDTKQFLLHGVTMTRNAREAREQDARGRPAAKQMNTKPTVQKTIGGKHHGHSTNLG